MNVWVYSVMRNEAIRLPYWLRHYMSFCDRVIIYDDDSDDGSREMMLAAGIDLRQCPWHGVDDFMLTTFCNVQYKEARGQADWIIWADGDEIVYHPSMRQRLEDLRQAGVTVPFVDGYCMIADGPPTSNGQIYEEINTGFLDPRYSKPTVINPNIDISWEPGRHEAYVGAMVTRAMDTEPAIKLLHYRWFGEAEFVARNERLWNSTTPSSRDAGFSAALPPDSTYPHHTLAWYRQAVQHAQPCL